MTQDDLTYFLLPMVRKGKEAVFSMGDDTQLTPFVARPRLFADHLRQRFAQVTNPPIDPYRESAVFDTTVYLGRLDGFFGGPLAGRSIALESPILSAEAFAWVLAQSEVRGLSAVFPVADGAEGAARALDELERAVVEAARAGAVSLARSGAAAFLAAPADSPSSAPCCFTYCSNLFFSAWRPRIRRDFTVPSETEVISAISS